MSFDGLNGQEGTTYVDKESSGTYYWSWVRKGDTLYTYDSPNAPADADVAKTMNLRYTFTNKYTGPLRFGFFLHDANDYVEIYSPGTRIGSASDCEPACEPAASFNSFGIVSGVQDPKSNALTKYTGSNPSGTEGDQYTKAVGNGANQRPGGYTVCRSPHVEV